jgi:hypothetical protein
MEVKASTKKETYKLLELETNVFLPPIAEANCDYISDVLSGDKLVSRLSFYALVLHWKRDQPHQCSSLVVADCGEDPEFCKRKQ